MPNTLKPIYKRILIKLSGESLCPARGNGIDFDVIEKVAQMIKGVKALKVEIAIVIGGGNIFRGAPATKSGMDRTSADYMGMLATVINAMALQSALENTGIFTRVMTAIEMPRIAEPYIRRRAIRHLEKGRIVIFAGGTGNPYFTTDTTAALRAAETCADVILKATKVDGIYSDDPMKNPDAVKFDELSYIDVIRKKLKVMDSTAITLCMDNKIPINVFNMNEKDVIKRVIMGEKVGTTVK